MIIGLHEKEVAVCIGVVSEGVVGFVVFPLGRYLLENCLMKTVKIGVF